MAGDVIGKLAIVGKARVVSPDELSRYDAVWTVGTNPIEADRYFCFHGEHSIHPELDTTWADLPFLHTCGDRYPLANSICVMLALIDYIAVMNFMTSPASVSILASPLILRREMLSERMAVNWWCGYLYARGIPIYWEGGPLTCPPYMLEEYFGHSSATQLPQRGGAS